MPKSKLAGGRCLIVIGTEGASTIQQFNGFIARYVGDGVLIYFGWPEAHETDAERAVRAGLVVWL